MKLVKWKFFMQWDHEIEEDWLNAMDAQGWILEKAQPFRYTFTKGEPGQYIYRLTFSPDSPKDKGLNELLLDSGAEYVLTNSTWQYYRRARALGPFEIYSDLDSRIAQFKRIRAILIVPIVLFITLLPTWDEITPLTVFSGIFWILVLLLTIRGNIVLHHRIQKLQKERELHE